MKKLTFWKSLFLLCALIVGSTSVWGQTTIWSEDFTGATSDAAITAPTNSAYTGVTYTCTNGTGTSDYGSTVIKNENTGGGTKPEIMIGKKGKGNSATGGKFTAVIPLDNYEGTLTLTYYQNKQTLKVSSTTTGVSGGQTLKPSAVGQQTTTFTGITTAMTSITIVFEATTTSNVRLDNIVLTGTKVTGIAAPKILPNGSEDISATHSCEVSLSCDDGDVTIYYTTDGSNPQTSDTKTVYTTPFTVSGYETIVKAVSKKGDDFSSVTTAVFKDPSIQLVDFTLNLNNAFFGTSYTGANAKGSGPHSNTKYGTTVTFTSGGSTNDFYISDTEIRGYSGNTLKFDAPSGYAFTKMTFASAWNSSTTITGGGSLNSTRKIWSNSSGSTSVSFAPGGRSDITTIAIELAPVVTITDAKYASYVTTEDADFANTEGVTAYKVTAANATTITMEPIDEAPKGTPVILKANASTYALAVAENVPAAITDNLLQAGPVTGDGASYYVLGKDTSNKLGFGLLKSGVALPATKAYLPAESVAGARVAFIPFDNDATAVNFVVAEPIDANAPMYNLAGQRVNKSYKGVVIVNGKKMLNK